MRAGVSPQDKVSSSVKAIWTHNGSVPLRVRIIDRARATLTLNSAVSDICGLEFEYEIPLTDGAVPLRESGLIEELR